MILKKMTNKRIRILVYVVLFILSIILPLIATTTKEYTTWLFKYSTMWERAIFDNNDSDTIACRIIVILFIVNVIASIALYIVELAKKKKTILLAFVLDAALSIVMLIVSSRNGGQAIASGGIVALVFNIILSLMGCAYYVISMVVNKDEYVPDKKTKEKLEKEEEIMKKNVNPRISNIIVMASCIVSGIVSIIMMFIPLYSTKTNGTKIDFVPAGSLKNITMDRLPGFITFIVLFLVLVIGFAYLLSIISYWKSYPRYFIEKAKKFIYANFVTSILYFLTGLIVSFIKQVSGTNASTISYIPFILSSVVMIIYAILSSLWVENEPPKETKSNLLNRVEMLIYVILFTLITFVSIFFKLLRVTSSGTEQISIVGFNVLRDYAALPTSYQLLAFYMYALLGIIASLVVVSIVSFFKSKKLFVKFSFGSILANVMFVATTGLFGIYYQIVQAMNQETLADLFAQYGFTYTGASDYKVTSETILAFFISLALLVMVIIRNPVKEDAESVLENASNNENNAYLEGNNDTEKENNGDLPSFDACPAFSELDGKIPTFTELLNERQNHSFENPTLPGIVSFVVDYARDSRLHLSYSTEDIATFVAGLGATRLSILQGMSGTGKTSLPKIFLEALNGNCEIVEVESSWRDKNELLGYYNEFSKTFTPKKFTQALYKAKLNEEVLTFIVLDEMNLSRIEYYFSDFLSLMENEEDKRQIKLLNVKLYNTYDGEAHSYAGLSEDHTIKIPTNVWFIGTANRDESTFEISDKVYDRAHTMNFNKRAPKVSTSNAPMEPRYLSYQTLIGLINDAKNNYQFDIDKSKTVKKVEEILAPYNISFGNRISKQIEEFVKVYCSCFTDKENAEEEALETILLSKVVAKLETKSVENKEVLIAEFNKLNLKRCAEFVSKLNED